jgi:hypothetical protein
MIIGLIEKGAKVLSEVDFSNLWGLYSYFYGVSFLILFWAMKTSRNEVGSQLQELGIGDKKGRLKVRETPKYFEISNVGPKFLYLSYWRDHFEILGNLLNRRFVDVKIITKFRTPRVRLYFDNLPEKVDFEKCPELEPLESWIGVNQFGEDVIVDFKRYPSLYIDGKPGSGKSTAIETVLRSLLKGQDQFKVMLVTTKPDFRNLKQEVGEGLVLIDIFDGLFADQAQNIMAIFKEIDDMAQNHRKTGELSSIQYMLIFDEAKDYLAKERSDDKITQGIKEELINLVYTHIRRNARYLQVPIIVASQTQNEGDLAIPLKMFHLRLASSTNEAMSRILCGDKRLTDQSFNQGKFLLKMPENEHMLRIAM